MWWPQGETFSLYTYLKGVWNQVGLDSSPEEQGTRGNGFRLPQGRLRLDTRNNFCRSGQGPPGKCWGFHACRYSGTLGIVLVAVVVDGWRLFQP